MKRNTTYSRKAFLHQSGFVFGSVLAASPLALFLKSCSSGSDAPHHQMDIKHVLVAARKDRFLGWPANNGLWSWDNRKELLVGFSDGEFVEREGHNIGPDPLTRNARSLDGGHTWSIEYPENFVRTSVDPVPSPGNIDFTHPDFALRVVAEGYHAANDSGGFFQVSLDRGKTWTNPYRFTGLGHEPELQGLELTARTNYIIRDRNTCMIMMSARNPALEFGRRLDKGFAAITTDRGSTFRFLSWMVPWTDHYRAVMPSVVQTPGGKLVAALRRRNPRNDAQSCWIDTFHSNDDGRSWHFQSRVAETGLRNGNPPALTLLGDGRLACGYANRSKEQILTRYSSDEGWTWSSEMVVRANPLDNDIGYPQLIQNHNGELVAIYYLADDDRPQSFIEAAIWKP